MKLQDTPTGLRCKRFSAVCLGLSGKKLPSGGWARQVNCPAAEHAGVIALAKETRTHTRDDRGHTVNTSLRVVDLTNV